MEFPLSEKEEEKKEKREDGGVWRGHQKEGNKREEKSWGWETGHWVWRGSPLGRGGEWGEREFGFQF